MHFMVTPTCVDPFVNLCQQCVWVSCHFFCVPVMTLLCSNKDDETMLLALQRSTDSLLRKGQYTGILAFQWTNISNIVLDFIEEHRELS